MWDRSAKPSANSKRRVVTSAELDRQFRKAAKLRAETEAIRAGTAVPKRVRRRAKPRDGELVVKIVDRRDEAELYRFAAEHARDIQGILAKAEGNHAVELQILQTYRAVVRGEPDLPTAYEKWHQLVAALG
jgi:hypothetical protein